jgi:hypothetical protein
MNPDLFTLIFEHPEAETVIVTGAPLGEAVAYALGARGAQTISIHPMNYWDKDGDPDLIVERSRQCVLCEARPQGGLTASYIGVKAKHVPRWAQEMVRRLDTGMYEARRAAAAAKARHVVYGLEHRVRVMA